MWLGVYVATVYTTSLCGTRLHEGQHRRLVVIGSRDRQGCIAVVVSTVDIGTSLQQRSYGLHMTAFRSLMQRGLPVVAEWSTSTPAASNTCTRTWTPPASIAAYCCSAHLAVIELMIRGYRYRYVL